MYDVTVELTYNIYVRFRFLYANNVIMYKYIYNTDTTHIIST